MIFLGFVLFLYLYTMAAAIESIENVRCGCNRCLCRWVAREELKTFDDVKERYEGVLIDLRCPYLPVLEYNCARVTWIVFHHFKLSVCERSSRGRTPLEAALGRHLYRSARALLGMADVRHHGYVSLGSLRDLVVYSDNIGMLKTLLDMQLVDVSHLHTLHFSYLRLTYPSMEWNMEWDISCESLMIAIALGTDPQRFIEENITDLLDDKSKRIHILLAMGLDPNRRYGDDPSLFEQYHTTKDKSRVCDENFSILKNGVTREFQEAFDNRLEEIRNRYDKRRTTLFGLMADNIIWKDETFA